MYIINIFKINLGQIGFTNIFKHKKTLENIEFSRVFNIAETGFEPVTFGL